MRPRLDLPLFRRPLFRRPLRPSLRGALRSLRRSPLAYWAAAIVLGIATFTMVQRRSSDLDERSRQLGPLATTIVARSDLLAGDLVGADDVEQRTVPQQVIPRDAVESIPDGTRLTADVFEGEVLVAARLTGGATSALAAALPTGHLAVAVPMAETGLDLERGDRVSLLALGSDGYSEVIATGQVISVGDSSVTVAVASAAVGPVADALLAGTITIALTNAESGSG